MSPSRASKRTRAGAGSRNPTSRSPKKARGSTKYPFQSDAKDSSEQGKHALEWMLHPLPLGEFFSKYFEKKPKLWRHGKNKFRCFASKEAIRDLLLRKALNYSELDVTSYTIGEGRQTHNLTGVAGVEAWKKYEAGCSLRLRRPQAHIDAVYRLCTILESFLECIIGTNLYLTPRGSQGFAPHFDDVDALICQVEGRKRWRVYKRRDDLDVLPRHSSVDFTSEDTRDMKLILDTVLNEGDMLYLPRGVIHEASCADAHSLHVTVSLCQRWTWADLLLAGMERAVEEAAAADKRLRQTVPLRFGRIAGAGAPDNGPSASAFAKQAQRMAHCVADRFPVDFAADHMMARFVSGRLPPSRAPGTKEKVSDEDCVRAVAASAARLVVGEDGLPLLLSCAANRRDAKAVDEDESQKSVTCLPEEAAAVQMVLDAYPRTVCVRDIPLPGGDRVELATGLVEMGVWCVERS